MKRQLFLALALSMPALAQQYGEPLRPQLSFSPARHWMNDPNGPVFFDGEYHLFFQYNPFGDTSGHISWGHAVSPDLLHWTELGVAIPATATELAFTGSVVIDQRNTSGLCEGGKPCMIAIYTAHHVGPEVNESQALAVSQDRGRTWTRYAGNPVLDLHMANFRDPSVTWSSEAHAWLMAVSLPDEHQVAFYTSANLKQWTRVSVFGPAGQTDQMDPKAQWECPTLVKLPAANPRRPGIWALKVGMNPGSLQGGSGEQYFLGSFDGAKFTQSTLPGSHGWTDYGKDSYCSIPFSNLPAGAAPTLVGWMDNWQYADKIDTAPWRGQMTLPRSLVFRPDGAGLALRQQPLVQPLRIGPGTPIATRLVSTSSLPGMQAPSELDLHFIASSAGRIGVRLFSDDVHYTEIAFDLAASELYLDRTHSMTASSAPEHFLARTPAPLVRTRPLNLQIIVDRSSVEVFAQDGTIAMTDLILPQSTSFRAEIFQTGTGGATRVTGKTWPLRSIWTNASSSSTQQ